MLLFLLTLIGSVGAWAFDGDYFKYTISPSTSANSESGWLTTWTSTETPALTMSCNAANFQVCGDNYDMRSGTSKSATYTLSAPEGYTIASYQFQFSLVTAGKNIQVTTDKGYTVTAETQTISKVYPNSSTAVIKITGDNDGVLVSSFNVEVVKSGTDYATKASEVKTAVENAWSAYNSYSSTMGDNIITEATQLSSPYTATAAQEPNGHDVANLIPSAGDSKYWHTNWSSSVAKDVHYLQVSIADVQGDVGNLVVTLQRRKDVANDHPTKLRVMGYNDNYEGLTFAQGKDLGLLTFSYTSNGTDKSREMFDATGYRYLRFYWEESNGSYQRGYWHCGKFQLNSSRGYHRDLIDAATVTDLTGKILQLSDADLNNDNIDTYKSELQSAITAFNSATENTELSTITWHLKDINGNIHKTEVRRNCVPGTDYTTSLSMSFVEITGDKTVTATGSDQTVDLTFTIPSGFPQFAPSTDLLSAAKWYKLNVRNKYVKYDEESNTFYDTDDTEPTDDNKNGWFAFVGDPDNGFKIFNYGGGCAFGSDNVNTNTRIKGVRETDAAVYLFEKMNNDTWQVRDTRGANAFLNQQGTNLGIWNSNARPDNGNKFVITEVTGAEAQFYVTYDFSAADANGKNTITWYRDRFHGSDETTPQTDSKPYIGEYTAQQENTTISTANRHFTYTATHSLPFVEGKFYQMANRQQDAYIMYQAAGTNESGNEYVEGIKKGVASNNTDPNNLWYFERVPRTPDYYYIRSVGGGKYVKGTSGKLMFDTDKAKATAYRLLEASDNNGVRFKIGNAVLGSHATYDNNGGANMQISAWDNGSETDHGNYFWMVDFDESVLSAFGSSAIEAYDATLVGSFNMAPDVYSNIASKCAAFRSNRTGADLKAFLEVYQAPENRVAINENKFYQLVAMEANGNNGRVVYSNAWNGKSGGSDNYGDRELRIGNNGTTAKIPSSAFKFKAVDGGYKIEHANSAYWMVNLSASGMGDMSNPDLPIYESNAGVYRIENVPGQSATIWSFRSKDNDERYLHSGHTGDGNQLLVRTQNAERNMGCRWAIREITQITVSVSEAQWATLCLPMSVTIPTDENMTVYYISSITQDGVITLTEIADGTTLAPKTPVLIYSTAGTYPAEYNFAVSVEAGTRYDDNKLSGSTARRAGFNTTTSEYYGLATFNGEVGFYPSLSEKVAANKAYLPNSVIPSSVVNEARGLKFHFGNEETAIEGIASNQGKCMIYDLQGHRVQKMQRGNIYILNGKKVSIQ